MTTITNCYIGIYDMLFIIIMINLESAERGNPVDHAVRRVKAMMMNWGLGEGCSFIYAVLITAHKPLSADEIGKKTNYAYSSTINYLNTLIRLGLVERFREFRKNRYVADVNFVELIKAERARVKSYLKQLGSDLDGIKDLEPLRAKVESAIAYLKGVERVAEIKEE